MGKAHHMAKERSRVTVHASFRSKPEEGRGNPTVTAKKQRSLANIATHQPGYRFTHVYDLLRWRPWLVADQSSVPSASFSAMMN